MPSPPLGSGRIGERSCVADRISAEGQETRVDFWMIFTTWRVEKCVLSVPQHNMHVKWMPAKGSNSWVMAPNHRHYPEPHCCAIPALKWLYKVPVRLAWHDHTITHALCPHTWPWLGGGNGQFRRISWAIMTAQQTAAPVDTGTNSFFWGQSGSVWCCSVAWISVCYCGALRGCIIYKLLKEVSFRLTLASSDSNVNSSQGFKCPRIVWFFLHIPFLRGRLWWL